MLPRRLLPFAIALLAPLALLAGCGGDDSAATSAGTEGGGASGSTGSGGPRDIHDHLLITELMISPEQGEFVEIWNPTAAEIDLGNYYLSDNSAYFGIANGDPWAPFGSEGSDFLARFPLGTRIGAGQVLVIAANPDFEITHGRCADLGLHANPVHCGGDTTASLVAPENGALGNQQGLLTNGGEMLVLFSWSGVVGEPVQDIDYIVWGDVTMLGASEAVDKSAEEGYHPDTPLLQQRPPQLPVTNESVERCALETGEKASGGNGVTGHDETSEELAQSFKLTTTPSPGELNGCLSAL